MDGLEVTGYAAYLLRLTQYLSAQTIRPLMGEGPVTVSRREYAALNAAVGGEHDDVHRMGFSDQCSAKQVPQQPHPAYWTLLCAANVAAQAGHVRVLKRLCQLVGSEPEQPLAVVPRWDAVKSQSNTVGHIPQLSMARWLLIAKPQQGQSSIFSRLLTDSVEAILHGACTTSNLELLQYYFSEADTEHRQSQADEAYFSEEHRLRGLTLAALIHGQMAVLRWLMSGCGLTPEQLGAVWRFEVEPNGILNRQAPRKRIIRVPRGAAGDGNLLATLGLLVEELRLPWPNSWIMSYDLARWVHVRPFVNLFTVL
jgi:hypothetical protein